MSILFATNGFMEISDIPESIQLVVVRQHGLVGGDAGRMTTWDE
jgi:hypothetical protein